MSVIDIQNLRKKYGQVTALDGLDLSLEQGEVMGFIGPNGAGKTTTIRILMGLIRKNSGTALMFGKDTWTSAVELHRQVVYVPGDVYLWPTLTGGEVIDLIGKLRGGIQPERKKQLMDRFELDPTKRCSSYSKGNRQKVAIISALVSDAKLFILDEPTSGLDPLMESLFNGSIKELKENGKTILLSSHTLSVVEKLCDRVSIIRKGKIVESGTLDDLRHLTRTTLSVKTNLPIVEMDKLVGIHDLQIKENQARFQVEGDKLQQALDHISQFEIRSLESRPPTLEELFMHHYNDETKGRVAK